MTGRQPITIEFKLRNLREAHCIIEKYRLQHRDLEPREDSCQHPPHPIAERHFNLSRS